MTHPADDDATPVVQLGPYELLAAEAVKLRDAILVRAQQHSKQDDAERSERAYRLALEVQHVIDAARAFTTTAPASDDYVARLTELGVLRERAELLGVPPL